MPKNKVKNIGTSSLKVKPKKRPGLFKQLSQPFLPSNKKNKNGVAEETTEKITVPHMGKDDLGLFSGFDDMFLPDRTGLSESVFLSPEIEKYLKNGDSPLTIDIPSRDKCSSADSGYTSPPNELLSPPCSVPAKGILKKKRSNSPDVRCESPLFTVQSSDSRLYTSAPVLNGNGHLNRERPMSPLERAVSPLSVENALGFLDDVIEEEKAKTVKKSVSFGELAEVKNFTSDSSDNDICDDFKPIRKAISFGDVENLKRKKDTINECNKSFKKSVSFEGISEKSEYDLESDVSDSDESLIPVHDSDSSCSDSEKFAKETKETTSSDCSCDKVCQFEVEVKVVDIQPLPEGEGHINQNNEDYSCTLLDSFNILSQRKKIEFQL
ncbi:hypothetical protein ACF0H5_019102 [Mactra antiquata]